MKTKLFFLALLCTIALYSQTQIGTDIDGEALGDRSGNSVSLSSDGSIVAIGAYQNDGNGGASGHVRVYQNNSGIWTQIGNDVDSEVGSDNTGTSLSMSSDGSIFATGAPYNNGTGNRLGQVRVYQNISGVWTKIGNNIDGESDEDYSGRSVSLSSDGSVVAIGTQYNNGNGIESGHVRVYKNVSNVWTQLGADIDGEAAYDWSGYSVSLSSDGSIVAIGARQNSGAGYHRGHVRVYQNISGVWTQIGDDIDGQTFQEYSGESVSLSSDGSVVAIGAPYKSEIEFFAGCVRVYKNISGVWTQIGDDINGSFNTENFGKSVSLSLNGDIVAIGASANAGSPGHARIYKNVSDVWTQIGNDINGESSADEFGTSISLSTDGSTVAIGAPLNDGNGDRSGHVRVYDLSAILSIENNEISKNFSVYPNPVNNYLQLQLAPHLEFKTAAIYNYYGQLVSQSKTITINVSNLSSGVYFLEIETNKGTGIKKIIKK